jgi:hypothetical protein
MSDKKWYWKGNGVFKKDELIKKMKAKPPTNFDVVESVDYIWAILSDYRENCISEGVDNHDDIWDEICTAMACIEEECNMKHGKLIKEKE